LKSHIFELFAEQQISKTSIDVEALLQTASLKMLAKNENNKT